MAESDRDTLLRSIENFEATIDEHRANDVVLATQAMLLRLEEIEIVANALGDPVLAAVIEKLRRHLTGGTGLDG